MPSHRPEETRPRARPPLPYWLCMLLWLASGPLGAGAAASGRWRRASVEAGLTLAGIWLMAAAVQAAQSDGIWSLPEALDDGSLSRARLCWGAFCLCSAMALWGSDFWRMRHWHGKRADPLLDPTTLG